MLEWLKSTWSSWKVKVAVVGGALVVATSYGTCTVDPGEVSNATPALTEPASTGDTVPVSSTTTEANANNETTTSTSTTADETTTGTTTETE